MSIWSFLKDLLTVNDYYLDRAFSLGERPIPTGTEQASSKTADPKGSGNGTRGTGPSDAKAETPGQPARQKKSPSGFVRPKRGVPPKKGVPKRGVRPNSKALSGSKPATPPDFDSGSDEIYSDLQLNLAKLKIRFSIPPNKDVIIREFTIQLEPSIKGAVVYMEGLAARETINSQILIPLMLLSNLDKKGRNLDPLSIVLERLLPGNQVEEKDSFRDLEDGIMSGTTLVLVDGAPAGLLVETKGWEHRTVSRPTMENVVRGPQDAFVEHLRVNTALLRRRLRSDTLITEMLKVGHLSNTDCALVYLRDLANPKLVQEVRRRIQSIDTDYITDSGTLEQFIQDPKAMIFPDQLATERPDRVAAGLAEGQVGVMVDGDPFVLLMPVTFWALMHTAEDAYIRSPFATLLRSVRIMAIFLNLLLPGFYIAVVNYHPEMIPTDLLMSIAAARETIPFPGIWEIVIMQLSFELIREAGIRIPTIIGPTLGIVGALILGQAAVAANIISPLLVIVVAVTGLGSFAIPNYALSLALRTLSFVFLALGGVLGLYGLAIGVYILIVYVCTQKSFGIPIMSPVSPYRPPSGDVVLRKPVWLQEKRPRFLRSVRPTRQPELSRGWDPATVEFQETLEAEKAAPKGGNQDGGN